MFIVIDYIAKSVDMYGDDDANYCIFTHVLLRYDYEQGTACICLAIKWIQYVLVLDFGCYRWKIGKKN